MFKSNKLVVLAALLSLLMLIVLTVPAFAEEVTTGEEVEATVAETEVATEPETGDEAGTEDGTEAGTSGDTAKDTTASTKEETTTKAPNEADAAAKKKQLTRGIINLSVGALIVLILGILAIKNRAKIPTWWKSLKSECGKITWCPKDKLKKNVFVVVIIILVIAAAIGVLDFVFSRGMILLGDLFH